MTSAVNTKLAPGLSLPSRYYVDPAYYREELEWFFGRMWFHAGRADELPDRGEFVVRQVGDEGLIVVRGERGEISAFFNVCRHRGTRLCNQLSGRFASTIQCPYHAWTFDLAGNLVAAPHMDHQSDFRREDFPLVQAAVAEWAGHLFLNLSNGPEPLETQLDGLNERFRGWSMGQLRLAKRITYDVAANWKLIIHNYSECLHCPGVHPALQKLSHYLSGENEPPGRFFLGGRMRFRDGIGTLSFDGRRRRDCLPGLDENQCKYVYYYAFLPNFLLSLHPDYVMTHTLWPRDVGRTEIVCEWLFHPDAMRSSGFDPDDSVEFWDLTNRQDWHVCEEMQIGLKSRAYRPGPYSCREDLLPGFDQIILDIERRARRLADQGETVS
jgi:Rieske 2Fe-2S family protein